MRDDRLAARLTKLFAMLGSNNPGERENARRLLGELLQKHGKTWNDLTGLLETGSSGLDWDADDDPPAGEQSGLDGRPIELVHQVLQKYVDLGAHEYVAVALWILHAYLFDRFMFSPRLALLSPVRGCGKTTLLDVIERLLSRAHRLDGVSAASIYWLVDEERCAVLVDEADNLALGRNGALRAVFNSGHRRGGSIPRVIGAQFKKFSTFAPMAIASIGGLPLPLMHRSIVISMQRTDCRREQKRLDADAGDLDAIHKHLVKWARSNPVIDPDPVMPTGMRNRLADNWRPLIAIAEASGSDWAAAARDAAIALSRGRNDDEDIGVLLLRDIRNVFDTEAVDRLASTALVDALNQLEDGFWAEYRGPSDDQHPRRLSQAELAQLLKRFGIRPRTIWPLRRKAGSKSAKGYFRRQFEAAWRSYCQDGTPSQSGNLKHLPDA